MAKGLSARLDHAERLKVMHGSALPGSADDRETITIQPMGNDEADVPLQVPRSVMTRIIRARVEETLEIVRDRLGKSGYGSARGEARGADRRRVASSRACPRRHAEFLAATCASAGRSALLACPRRPRAGLRDGGGPVDLSAGGGIREQARQAASRLKMTGTGGRFDRVSQWI